jgi:hypothetical protein
MENLIFSARVMFKFKCMVYINVFRIILKCKCQISSSVLMFAAKVWSKIWG